MTKDLTEIHTEIVDKTLQDEANAFLERVLAVYKKSFTITNDDAAGLFKDNKEVLAMQLYEYAKSRKQITYEGSKQTVKLGRTANILLSRLKILYDWRRESFDQPEHNKIEKQKLLENKND